MYPDARLIPKWCRFLRTHYRNFETSKSWCCPKGQKPEARTRFTPHGPTGCNGATSKAILLQICEPLAEALGDGESEGAGVGEHEKRNLVHDTSSRNTVGRCIAHLLGLLPMRRVCSREKDRSCEGTERIPRRIQASRPFSRKPRSAACNRPAEPRSRCDTKQVDSNKKHRTRRYGRNRPQN